MKAPVLRLTWIKILGAALDYLNAPKAANTKTTQRGPTRMSDHQRFRLFGIREPS
jgi:hypothetical protein